MGDSVNVLVQSVLLVIKDVWRYCKEDKISSGHVSLVATVNDDEDDEGNDAVEARWHHHYPHTGQLPRRQLQVADGRGLYCLSTHRISIRLH